MDMVMAINPILGSGIHEKPRSFAELRHEFLLLSILLRRRGKQI